MHVVVAVTAEASAEGDLACEFLGGGGVLGVEGLVCVGVDWIHF